MHILPSQRPQVLATFAIRCRLLGPDQLALHFDDGLACFLHPDVEAVTGQRHDLFLKDKSVEVLLGEVVAEDADLLAGGREHGPAGHGGHGGGGDFGGGGGGGVLVDYRSIC